MEKNNSERAKDIPPKQFGRYKVLKLLGEGAMGRVYLSEDPILKRRLAIKVIAINNDLHQSMHKEYLERFKIEAQSCAILNHPSIVTVYDAGEESGLPWIAFEYVEGESLEELLRRQKRLRTQQCTEIAKDIVSAMIHAHKHNIIHRDIKPANILIDDKTGIAKLSDFGMIKSPSSTLTQDGSTVGSPGYMSPEQIDGTTIDCYSDIFSFGIVLYEMLTGEHPFIRESIPATFYATLNCNYKPLSEIVEDVPPFLNNIVTGTLFSAKKKRLSTVEIKHLLETKNDCRDNNNSRSNKLGELKKFLHPGFLTDTVKCYLKSTSFKQLKTDLFGYLKTAKSNCTPILKDFTNRICGFSWKDTDKHQLTIFSYCLSGLIILLLVVFGISTIAKSSKERGAILSAAEEKGYEVRSPACLIDTSRALLSTGRLSEARKVLSIVKNCSNNGLKAQVLKGRVALIAGDYGEASAVFSELEQSEAGISSIIEEHAFLMEDFSKLMKEQLSSVLIELAAHSLRLSQHPRMHQWTEDHHYWVRWNAVRILQNAGERVDLVPVYILDLTHSASHRTRVQAVERLGEFGDPRAIPALQAMSGRRGSGARVAQRVLREEFGVED
ncbi:protein kinase [Chitinispirillales bacterium ANBcel5]|uniref:serine/threonine-protein kinase n=1 Tax=Cellulosispirillum alkaliphilum TaxID=3039283 RepID=UPI002A56C9E7|nr:protein kinase [Chitinispirillales bacterium ANBcel5]